jgi:hypothetical protein
MDVALASAAHSGRCEVVNFLLSKGADVFADEYTLLIAGGSSRDTENIGGGIGNWNEQGEVERLLQQVAEAEDGQEKIPKVMEILLHHIAKNSSYEVFKGACVTRNRPLPESLIALHTRYPNMAPALLGLLYLKCQHATKELGAKEADDLALEFFQKEAERLNVHPDPWQGLAGLSKSLEGFSNIKDMVIEMTDALLLGALQSERLEKAEQGEIASIQAECRDTVISHLSSFSLSMLCRWNRLWHRPDQRLPIETRPAFDGSAWDPLFAPQEFGDYTVTCLTSSGELKREGDELGHCVGGGSYASACLEGSTQIVSIRGSEGSIATVELRRTERGRIKGEDGTFWSVNQFLGSGNGSPPQAAKRVWEEFLASCDAGRVKIETLGPRAGRLVSTDYLPAITRRTGIYPGESARGIVDHYLSLHLRDDDNNRIPLIPAGSELYSIVTHCD